MGPGLKGMGKGIVLLTVTPSDPLGKFCFLFCSADLEILDPGGVLLPGDKTNILPNCKLRLPPSYFCDLMSLNLPSKKKKRITLLEWVTDPDYQREIGFLFYNGGEQDYVWNTGDPLEGPLLLPCSVIKNNGKL